MELDGTMGENNWYRSNVNVSLTKDDVTSGVIGYGVSTSKTADYNNKSSVIQTSDTAGVTYYGYVKDGAGHTSKCEVSIKKDTVKPTCTINDTGNKGENNWYIGDVSLNMSTKDSLSDVATYGMDIRDNVTYNKNNKMSLTVDTENQTYYGYVKDNAGNTNTCMKSVKRDTVNPICTLELDGTIGNENWYKSDVNISLIKDDVTSGVIGYGVSTSKTADYNNKSSVIQTSDTAGVTYYGYVKDGAGHTSKCEKKFKPESISNFNSEKYQVGGSSKLWIAYKYV